MQCARAPRLDHKRLDSSLILEHISEHYRNYLADLYCLDSVDSTNDFLRRLSQQSPFVSTEFSSSVAQAHGYEPWIPRTSRGKTDGRMPDKPRQDESGLYFKNATRKSRGIACIADQQTKGKGTKGRSWHSPPGLNLYLSLLWPFERDPNQLSGQTRDPLSGLSLMVGLSVLQTLAACGIDQQQYPSLGLKWPNDVFCNGAKLGGILIEASQQATPALGPRSNSATENSNAPMLQACTTPVIVGIGLNVYPSAEAVPSISQAWTCLQALSPEPLARNTLVGLLLNTLIQNLLSFEAEGFGAFASAWSQADLSRGQALKLFLHEDCVVSGTGCGVDVAGRLLLKGPEGRIRAYASGEITHCRLASAAVSDS